MTEPTKPKTRPSAELRRSARLRVSSAELSAEPSKPHALRMQLEMLKLTYQFASCKCVFCGWSTGVKTGVLPIVGHVWKCEKCQADYEAARKVECP